MRLLRRHRFGSAAGCEARLCLAETLYLHVGLRPWFGLSPTVLGPKAIPGAQPSFSNKRYGEAKPRLTSGGGAVATGRGAVATVRGAVATVRGAVATLLLFLVLALFGFSSPVRAQDTPADNWSQFRGNHQLTGVSQSNIPSSLKPLWTYEAGESIESSAAIVGGTVFVGSQKGELVALSLDNGSVYWKFSTGNPIGESSPAYGNGAVFIGDLGGWLNALNASDGRKLWAFKTNGEIKSSPVVIGDRVLIGSYDEHLYCLNARNGSLLWKFKTNGPVHATPGISDGLAFIAGCDEMFRGIRISDGKEVFSVSSGAYTGASPALRSGSAFYGTFDNEVLSVNLAERKIAWHYEHPQRKFPFYSSAAVTPSRVVLGGRDKLVHGLTLNGKAAWTFTTRARVESSPAIAGDRVFVGSNDGRFYVLSLTNGAKLWEFEAGAPLSASPAIANGRIVIGSQDGRLYCFG